MMWVIIGTSIDKAKSKRTMYRAGGMKRTISHRPSNWGNRVGRSSRARVTPVPRRRATRRPNMRLGGPSVGPVRIQDAAHTLNAAAATYTIDDASEATDIAAAESRRRDAGPWRVGAFHQKGCYGYEGIAIFLIATSNACSYKQKTKCSRGVEIVTYCQPLKESHQFLLRDPPPVLSTVALKTHQRFSF